MSAAENPNAKLFGKESKLMFGQVREDSSVDLFLVDQISDARRAVVVASGGCTALSLLTLLTVDDLQVDALDISRAQIAVVELKVAVFKQLGFEAGRQVCVSDAKNSYKLVRDSLSAEARSILDNLHDRMDEGLNTAGWVDRSMRNLTKVFYAGVHSRSKTHKFLSLSSPEDQRVFYSNEWSSIMWRAITYIAFNKNFLALLHGSAALKLVPPDFSVIMRNRLEHALTAFPNATNPYLWQAFFSKYPECEEGLLPYLQKARSTKLIGNLGNLRLNCADMLPWLKKQEPASFDYFGLSNVLELLPEAYSASLVHEIIRCGRPGAIVCIRSIFPRKGNERTFVEKEIKFDKELTAQASALDRSLFCNFYEVYRVI